MIYKVRHRTTYSYQRTVTFARCVLRLRPEASAVQTVLESRVTTQPKAAQSVARVGPFGEHTLTVLLEEPHKTLVATGESLVDVHRGAVIAPENSPGWETIRELALAADDAGPLSPATFVYASKRVGLTDEITDYARASFPAGRPILEAAGDLMRRIHADFAYDSKATTVSTPPAEAFEARRGVCQDFAHIMIAAMRGLGLPAAYVSGYLRTIPPPGQPRLEGADATHAWVSVWGGEGRGWIGVDPTNAIYVEDDHIVLATGRDYSDVAPIDGIMLASGDQKLKVEVDVIPQDELGVVRPDFGARTATR